MARDAQDREDLLRDATAFAARVQMKVFCGEKPIEVFAGFRTGGAVSLYFDQDPVYHFNACGQLRRAFVDNRLIKAEKGKLVSLTRQCGEGEVAMIRLEMTREDQQLFCASALLQLRDLSQAMSSGENEIEGQVQPIDHENVVIRLMAFLEPLDEIKIADSPRVAD